MGTFKTTAKECAFMAVFVALLIASQFILSAIPGIELVTMLFISYSCAMGSKRGMLCATAFSLLRQFIFGALPTVLILYLIYYNLLTFTFGKIGKNLNIKLKNVILIVILACAFTALFTLLDDIITPLYNGYSPKATKLYFYASLPVMSSQVICTAISSACLFVPFFKVFKGVKKPLDY
ncbi:MAG: hypothetical protein IKJ19_03780 [Clostridia bacterium]|nr:hypothetical protein [Clostridia bacterium]